MGPKPCKTLTENIKKREKRKACSEQKSPVSLGEELGCDPQGHIVILG